MAPSSDWATLRWLMLITFLHGLVYLIIVPPWQHYDEPTHFEYAHQIAETGAVPTLEAVSVETRWQIAESMGRFHFWGDSEPGPIRGSDLPSIGVDQRVHPPFYYGVAALPIRATMALPIEIRLYAARLLSVLLYTMAVAAVWRISVVVAPDQPTVQLAVPLIYAAVPPFAAIMTAVNNDVLVNFTGATLLLGCVLLIRDGPRPIGLMLAMLSLAIGVLAKRTALIGVVPLALALFWAVVRRPVRLERWLLLVAAAALGAAVAGLRIDTSGPAPTLGLRPWVNALDATYLRLNLEQMTRSLTDWTLSASIYPRYFAVAFTSFWAAYGWGQVQIGQGWVWALLAVSITAGVGLGVRGIRYAPSAPTWHKRISWLFLTVAAMGIVAMILRIHPLPAYGGSPYVPRGRYLFSGLPATIWLIAQGAMGLAPRQREQYPVVALLLFMIVFESFGIARLVYYYYGIPWPIAVLAAEKPGLFGLPPLYPLLITLYIVVLTTMLRRLPRTH